MPALSITLAEVLEVRDAPLEVPAAWALLHNAALFIQDAHNAQLRSPDPSISGGGPHLIIHPETLLLHRRGKVQFASGIQESVDTSFIAPELQHQQQQEEEEPQISGANELAQTHVFSLAVLISTTTEFNSDTGSTETSKALALLLSQMKDNLSEKRPTLDDIIALSAEQLEAICPGSSADEELDKLFSLVYGDEDQLERSYGDSDSIADDATLAAEIAAVESHHRSSICSADQHSSVNGSHSEDCMSLTSRGSQGIHGSMDSLHRQGSTRSSSSAAAALNPVLRVTDATRRAQKFPSTHRWSSYERLKLQPKDLEVLASKASNSAEHSRSLFYTPVRHRRANTPDSTGTAGLPPRPPSLPRSSASNDHDKSGPLFQTTSGTPHGIPAHAIPSTGRDHQDLTQPTGQLTSLQKLDQLLVELNSPLHSESAPILTAVPSTEASLPPASSSPNITAVTETTSSLPGGRLPTPPTLHVDIHPEMDQQAAVSGWEEDATPPTPPPPTSPPPPFTPIGMPPVDHTAVTAEFETAEEAPNSSKADSTFEYSTLSATPGTHSESTDDEFQVVTPPHPPESSPPPLNEVKTASESPQLPLRSSVPQLPVEEDTEQEHGEEQDCADNVLTPRRALDEAFEELDNEVDHEEDAMTGMTRDPTYASLKLETSPAKQQQKDQQDDDYATPHVAALTTTTLQGGNESKVKVISDVEGYTEPWTGEQVHFKPMHGEDNYALPSRVRTKVKDGTTAESVVLRGHHHLLPASLRSASVEDVSGSPVVSGPVRASMPPDSLLSHGLDEVHHDISSSLTPSPSTLSHPPSQLNAREELSCLPASDQSISKLQSMLGAEFTQLTGGPRKEKPEIQQQSGVLKGKRRVHVRLLNGNTLLLYVNPECLCRDFFHHVVCLLDIKHWTSFGLSVRQADGMRVFLEPDRKIYKYAPEGWLKTPMPEAGDRNPQHYPHDFTVHFRVMFYIRSPSHLKLAQTRHLYYLQLRQDMSQNRMDCSREQALQLASLALQAEHGDFADIKDHTHYFELNKFLSSQALRGQTKQSIIEQLKQLHSQHYGLSKEEAEETFLWEAMAQENYGKIAYQVSRNKRQAQIAFTVEGISVHDVLGEQKTLVLECAWRNTSNIAFDHHKLTLKVEGKEPVVVCTQGFRRAAYFFRFAKLCHNFHTAGSHQTGRSPAVAVKIKRPVQIVPADYEGEEVSLKLLKKEGQGLGLRIRDHISQSGIKYSEVETLVKGGAADGILKQGDLLLTLNGQSLCQLTHKEVGERLTSSPPLVAMTIFRRTPSQVHSTDKITPAPLPLTERQQQTAVNVEQTEAHPPSPTPPPTVVSLAPHEEKPSDSDHKMDDLKEARSLQDAEKNTAQEHPERERSTGETTNTPPHLEGEAHGEGGEVSHELSIDKTPGGGTAVESSPSTLPHLTSTTTLENKSLEETPSRLVPLASTDLQTVCIRRKEGSFGFAIKGSRKNPYHPVRVSMLTPEGSAEESGLCKGDCIIAVNGETVEGKGYGETLRMLTTAGDTVELLVAKGQAGTNKLTVMLNKEEGKLGFRFTKQNEDIVVTSVTSNTQAAQAGLRPGDVILQVNGQSFVGTTHREASEILSREQSKVCLLVERHTQPHQKLDPILEQETRDIFTVTLRKEKNQLGFRISKDLPIQKENKGIFIASVDQDPALSDGRLKSGDEILRVNGKSLIGMGYKLAVQMLRAECEECTFVIRKKQFPAHQIPEIHVTETDGDSTEPTSEEDTDLIKDEATAVLPPAPPLSPPPDSPLKDSEVPPLTLTTEMLQPYPV